MKKLMLSLLLISFCVVMYAQNVGIGTPTPTAQLDVSGTLRFRNNNEGAGKILSSDNLGNASWQPLIRTEIYSVSSAAFQPDISSNILVRTSGQGGVAYYPTAVSASAIVAPVNLPQGANVTEITFFFEDNSPEDLSLLFESEALDFGSFTFLAITSTSGASADWRSVTVTPSTPIIIDNTNLSYSVRAYGNWPGTFDLAVKGVRIKYTYTVNN